MIVVDSKKQLTLDIISKVADSRISLADACKLLNKSRRTIERYLKRYRSEGVSFVIHGNTGKAPANKKSDTLKQQVQLLIREKYFDLNLQHLAELLRENDNIDIQRETLRGWAHEIHHVKRAKKRRAKARKRRERMASPGLMLQMDGSPHRWFGDKKSCLIAIIDDATSEVHAEFFPSETTQGCLKILRDYIAKKGLFKTLYVDRAGIFGGPKRCNFSQVQRACDELGVEIIFARSPQGKGRIERAFDTFQDRLVPELRLHNITDMVSANHYLQRVFIPEYWQKRIEVNPKDHETNFTDIPEHLDLNKICIQKYYRKIRNDHTFSYNNKFYLITSDIKHSIARQKIEIYQLADESISAWFAGKQLNISEVIEPTKPSVYDSDIQKKIDAIELAEKLGNVAEAARISGCSRETIYKNRKLFKEKGPEALKRRFREDHHHRNRTDKDIETIVINFSIENPHLGQAQVARHIQSVYSIEISAGGVRNIWLREKMNTMALRLQRAEIRKQAV